MVMQRMRMQDSRVQVKYLLSYGGYKGWAEYDAGKWLVAVTERVINGSSYLIQDAITATCDSEVEIREEFCRLVDDYIKIKVINLVDISQVIG